MLNFLVAGASTFSNCMISFLFNAMTKNDNKIIINPL